MNHLSFHVNYCDYSREVSENVTEEKLFKVLMVVYHAVVFEGGHYFSVAYSGLMSREKDYLQSSVTSFIEHRL